MMKDLANDCDFLWPKEKFLTRFDSMREIYRRSQSDHKEDSRIFLVSFKHLKKRYSEHYGNGVVRIFRRKILSKSLWILW